jgi:multidrug transporter EmrE-like cation transporter
VATLKVTFYVLLFGLSLFLIRVDFGQSLHVVDKWYLWGNLIALAIFPTAISFLCTTQAVQYIGSTPTAILGALEPVTAVFFGVTIFGESLTLRLCCGIDYPGCDIYYSRKQYYDTFGTVQEVVSTIAFEAYKKIDSTGYPSDRRNTSFTTSSPLSLSTFHKSERYFCILFAASIRLARMDNQI